jgi:hypothetical protein
VISANYVIPRTISTPTVNNNSTFLILNSEFQNQTWLSGFTLNGAVGGSITIQVKTQNYYLKLIINFLINSSKK